MSISDNPSGQRTAQSSMHGEEISPRKLNAKCFSLNASPVSKKSRNSAQRINQLLQWQTTKESKLKRQSLKQLQRVEDSLREVPEINAVSRRMAELLMDGKDKPTMHILSAETAAAQPELNKNYLLIKNPRKLLDGSTPVKLNLKLTHEEVAIAPEALPQPEEPDTRVVSEKAAMYQQLRAQMNAAPRRRHMEAQQSASSQDLFHRTTDWKKRADSKIEVLAQQKKVDEMKECTFKPATTANTPKSSDKKRTVKSFQNSQKRKCKYAPISPQMARVSYFAGLNMRLFKTKAKPLIPYQAVPLVPK